MADPSEAAVEVEVFDTKLDPKQRRKLTAILAVLALFGLAPLAAVLRLDEPFWIAFWVSIQTPAMLLWASRLLRHFVFAPAMSRALLRFAPGGIQLGARFLTARRVGGASTAVKRDGTFEIALALRGQSRPLLIRTKSDEVVTKIHEELGLAQRDANIIGWPTGSSPWLWYAAGVLVCAIHACLIGAIADQSGGSDWQALLFFLTGLPIGLLATRISSIPILEALVAHPKLSLSTSGVHLANTFVPGAHHNRLGAFIPYTSIVEVLRSDNGIRLRTRGNPVPIFFYTKDKSMLSFEELDHVVAQIRTAMRRAQGSYTPAGVLDETLSVIERRGSTETWLAQITSLEQSQSQGYRGNALDRDALLRAASDPDIAPAARFAAARLLRQDPDARVRIEAKAASSRFEPEQRMLRVALGDDLAPAEVDELLSEVEVAEHRYRVGSV